MCKILFTVYILQLVFFIRRVTLNGFLGSALPTSKGGLGLPRSVDLAGPAVVAFMRGVSDLV